MIETNSPCTLQLSGSIALYRNHSRQVVSAIKSFFSSSLNTRLIVVDNSPNDVLRSVVEGEGAQYIFNGKNIGFGPAHNIGIRECRGFSEYHLILNPDVTFGAETLPALHAFMQQNPSVGLVMPKILYPDTREQKLCKLLPTPLDLCMRRFGGRISHILSRQRMARYLLENIDLNKPHFVPNLSGCFMFARMEALQMVGLFDERYFLYLEDVDLCRQIAEKWDTVFYPYASITHEYANGSYRNLHHLRLHAISALQYFNKWGWLHDPIRSRLNARTVDPSLSYVDRG